MFFKILPREIQYHLITCKRICRHATTNLVSQKRIHQINWQYLYHVTKICLDLTKLRVPFFFTSSPPTKENNNETIINPNRKKKEKFSRSTFGLAPLFYHTQQQFSVFPQSKFNRKYSHRNNPSLDLRTILQWSHYLFHFSFFLYHQFQPIMCWLLHMVNNAFTSHWTKMMNWQSVFKLGHVILIIPNNIPLISISIHLKDKPF